MEVSQNIQTDACRGAVSSTLEMLTQAVEMSGWSESTFCVRVLRYNNVREKLTTGNIKVQKIATIRQQLEDYITETMENGKQVNRKECHEQ